MKIIGTVLAVIILSVLAANAQKRRPQQPRQNPKGESVNRSSPVKCGGGVLNKKAVSLPQPEYPAIAKTTQISGSVVVRVNLNESGNVTEARACAGNTLLREAAVEAAKQAKFEPTLIGGKSYKVAGVIIYNFKPEITGDVVVLSCPPTMNIIKILNGYAVNLVKPEFPKELQKRRLSGAVVVQVTIDEKGKVSFVEAVSGHPDLRGYAEAAVRKSIFRRFERCGKPIKLTSTVVYNFTASK